MNIQLQRQPTFNARNSTIRFADDIVRKVNREYPRISATKIESFDSAKFFPYTMNNLWESIYDLRNKVIKDFFSASNFGKRISGILAPIKKYKLGNCKESAQLSLIGAKVNGIKNCKICYLESPSGYNYDHAVVLVKGKKPYIIDAWLGFADYVPKAIERYQKEFRNCFDFKEAKTEKMLVREDVGIIQNFLNNKTSSLESREIIKKTFPELILKKN